MIHASPLYSGSILFRIEGSMNYLNKLCDSGDESENTDTFFSLGFEFLEPASALHETPIVSIKYWVPIFYLAGHAAELLLKSFLVKRGLTVSELKKKGHNLYDLIELSKIRGLSIDLIAIPKLSYLYLDKRFEYRKNNTSSLPDEDLLIEEVYRLFNEINRIDSD